MLPPSTNKLLIINSILLVAILSMLLILNYNDLINKIIPNHSDLDEAYYDDEAENKYYEKQDTINVCYNGFEDDTVQLPAEIFKIIKSELGAYNWNEDFQEEDLHSLDHVMLFSKPYPSDDTPFEKLVILIFSNYSGNYSHASAGRISLFEFQQYKEIWHLTDKFLAFGYGDEYGLEPLDCELVQIGSNNKYAVIVPTSYSNMGHDKESRLVFTEVEHSFRLVFDFTSYEYYTNYLSEMDDAEGYSTMRILKSNKDFFDIETKREENEWSDKRQGALKRYIFDGEGYVEFNKESDSSTN
jgi:hypothetical protein